MDVEIQKMLPTETCQLPSALNKLTIPISYGT